MKLPTTFEDDTWEEYQIYLETAAQKEESPMSYDAFEWLKIREIQYEIAELYEDSYEDCI